MGSVCCNPPQPAQRTSNGCSSPISVGQSMCNSSVRKVSGPNVADDSCSQCPSGEPDGCNESCIDRAAAIECMTECDHNEPTISKCCSEEPLTCFSGRSSTSQILGKRCGGPSTETGRPQTCSDHITLARRKYGAVAGAVRCICRILRAKNLESCCRPHRSSVPRPAETLNPDHAWVSGYTPAEKQKGCCEKTGCIGTIPAVSKPPSFRSCTAFPEPNEPQTIKQENNCKQSYSSKPTDLEKGETHLEHIVLSVSGMTCSGCEISLSRALAAFAEVRNLQVSLILARAAFDLDTSRMSVDDILAYLPKATKFTCARLSTKGRKIEVIHPHGAEVLIHQVKPPGILTMKKCTEQIVEIEYDPEILGARDLLQSSFDVPLQLAPTKPPESVEAGDKQVRKEGIITFVSAILTIPVLVLAWAPVPEHPIVYGSVSLALATLVQVGVAGPFYPVAFKNLVFSRLMEVDLLIVLSTSAAYVFSVVAFAYQLEGKALQIGEFFETSTLIVTLIMLGRFISAWARQRAAQTISFRTLQAPTAVVVNDESNPETEIDARLLQYGDVFKVSPESQIVTDGTVVRGASEVDESMVTGESRPVAKEVGSPVIAGSLNGWSVLHVRLSRLPGDNTISAVADMVDEAKMRKSRSQELADRIAAYFVPVILCITIMTFVGWMGYGVGKQGQSASRAAENAVSYAIAVLIVSCPCAIGLCVPMVIVLASGVAARHGVIFRKGQTVEIARKTTHVVFDKTGTLTEGKLTVVQEMYPEAGSGSIKPLILGLVKNNKHPVSAAVARHLAKQGIVPAQINEVKTMAGQGLQGVYQGSSVSAGNCRWLRSQDHATVKAFASMELTVFCVTVDQRLCAVFGLEDAIRPDSRSVVSELQNRNISVSVVSGDDNGPVQRLASRLGIPPSHVISQCSPREKMEYLEHIMRDKNAVVVFCGDGTNDAPALAQAHIGIHVSEGSEVAKSVSDVVLVRPALGGILCLIDLSKAAVSRIMLNFCWSFIYNLVAVLLAAGLFVKWTIPPQYAALGEVVSVLPVIGIALHLRYIKLAWVSGKLNRGDKGREQG